MDAPEGSWKGVIVTLASALVLVATLAWLATPSSHEPIEDESIERERHPAVPGVSQTSVSSLAYPQKTKLTRKSAASPTRREPDATPDVPDAPTATEPTPTSATAPSTPTATPLGEDETPRAGRDADDRRAWMAEPDAQEWVIIDRAIETETEASERAQAEHASRTRTYRAATARATEDVAFCLRRFGPQVAAPGARATIALTAVREDDRHVVLRRASMTIATSQVDEALRRCTLERVEGARLPVADGATHAFEIPIQLP